MRWIKSRRVTAELSADSGGGADVTDDADAPGGAADASIADSRTPSRWVRVSAHVLLPALIVGLVSAAGYLKWQDVSLSNATSGDPDAVQAATDGTIALLSYRPDTVVADLDAAQQRLTGSFLDSYRSLTHDVVIPGAQQKQISAVATVPAASAISTSADRSVVLAFVNQTVIVGQGAPTSTTSSVRVTLDRIDGRWLISGFDPV